MTITCVAIDDEKFALDAIRQHIARVPWLDLKASFQNPVDAMEFLQQYPTDLIFLDVSMPELSGIQLLNRLDQKPHVILTTAYSQYALDGYDLNVVDFILKPFDYERFLVAVEKVHEKMSYIKLAETYHMEQAYITVRVEYKKVKVFLEEIVYIEAMDNYSKIYTGAKPVLTLQNLGNLCNLLPPGDFIRIHKSYIVSRKKIDSYLHNKVKVKGKELPIGRSYRKVFDQQMNHQEQI